MCFVDVALHDEDVVGCEERFVHALEPRVVVGVEVVAVATNEVAVPVMGEVGKLLDFVSYEINWILFFLVILFYCWCNLLYIVLFMIFGCIVCRVFFFFFFRLWS